MATYARHAKALEGTREEIAGERAAALGRVTRRLEKSLAALEAARARAVDPEPFNTLRDRALQHRWELQVQRECLGLTDWHRTVKLYPIPPRR